MAFTHKITRQIEINGGAPIAQSRAVTGSGEANLDETVPDEAADLELSVAIDFSALKSLYIESDQDVTIESNDGTTPDDTITLKANSPLEWDDESPHANPLTADVTAIFVTNASGGDARLRLFALMDATP